MNIDSRAKESGAVFYAHRSSPHEPAVAFSPTAWEAFCASLEAQRVAAHKYRMLCTPEIHDFLVAVEREALHQRNIHAHKGDAGKSDADWFWLLGYLGGKALHAGNLLVQASTLGSGFRANEAYEKQLHHIITTAAACLNWHAARVGAYQDMRPGIAAPEDQS